MDKKAIRKLILLFAALFVLLACELPALTAPASPGPEPIPIETIIAGTVAAAQTQTANMLPSPTKTSTSTPLPTKTPTATPTPTETVIFIIPTSTKPFEPHSAGSDCDLVALTPYRPVLDPGAGFDVQWTIQNTSDEVWWDTNVDFKHTGGTDMHKRDIYDLPESVPQNRSVNLTVAMVSPKKSGTYTTTWVLSTNKKTLCKVSATVIVK